MVKTRHEVAESAESGTVTAYVRLHAQDLAELRRREAETGAPVSAQVRIIVRDALRGARKVKVL